MNEDIPVALRRLVFRQFAFFTQTGVIASAAKQSPDDANEIASSLRSSQ
jgi:hypothetical protein